MKRRRRRCRFVRCLDLVERLAPYVQPIDPESERLVSVEPIRWWLQGWAAATGDRPELIAMGFGLELEDVVALLIEHRDWVTVRQAQLVCEALQLDLRAMLKGQV